MVCIYQPEWRNPIPFPSRQIHADSLKNLLQYIMLSTDQETEFSQRNCIKSIVSLENVYVLGSL